PPNPRPHLSTDVRKSWPYFVVDTGTDDTKAQVMDLLAVYYGLNQLPYDAIANNSNTYAHQAINLMGGVVKPRLYDADGVHMIPVGPEDYFQGWGNTKYYGGTGLWDGAYHDQWGRESDKPKPVRLLYGGPIQ